jgi:predicted transposase/invertase (TIGR01784 family)
MSPRRPLHETFLSLATCAACRPTIEGIRIFTPGIDKWLYLLAHGEDIDPEGPRYGEVEKDIQEAVEIMETYTKAQKARYTYDRRLEWERLRAEEIRENQEARENGRAEGLAEGHAEGLTEGRAEVARRLKERGMDLETIASITRLELEDVKRL